MAATPTLEKDAPSAETVGRVLVADSDPASRDVLVSLLAQNGFTMLTAANATEAATLVQGGTIDVVLADIHLPGNEQLEMVRALTEMEDAPAVILVTGRPSIETAAHAVRLRVFDYLVKPVDKEKLVNVVGEGVELSHRLRFCRRHRALLTAAVAETERCAQLARSAPSKIANEALSTYFKLAVQQALSTVADIGTLAEAALARNRDGTLRQRLDAMHPMLLLEAIRETIRVLEGTKSSFRSRELQELRVKLERLLDINPGAERPNA